MQRWNHFWGSAKDNTQVTARLSGLRNSRLWREEEGQTLVEYGLLIALLALITVAALTFFGRRMSNNLYGTANNGLPFNN